MEQTDPQPLPPVDIEQRFAAALQAMLDHVRQHGLREWTVPDLDDKLVALADVFDEVFTYRAQCLGEPRHATIRVLDESISTADLRELAAGPDDEPIQVPPVVLRRLLEVQEPAATGPLEPATVDVFVDGTRCQTAPGRTQGASRWLQVDLPGKGLVEVLVKPKRPEAAS